MTSTTNLMHFVSKGKEASSGLLFIAALYSICIFISCSNYDTICSINFFEVFFFILSDIENNPNMGMGKVDARDRLISLISFYCKNANKWNEGNHGTKWSRYFQ